MEYDIGIMEKYLDITVKRFENMYPFIEPDKEEKGEIKIGLRNTLYKKRMRDLINTKQEGHAIYYKFEERILKNEKRYFCPECKNFVLIMELFINKVV